MKRKNINVPKVQSEFITFIMSNDYTINIYRNMYMKRVHLG